MPQPYDISDVIPKDGAFGTKIYPTCTHCGKPAKKQVQFKEEGAVVIERYCEECTQPKTFRMLQKRYGR